MFESYIIFMSILQLFNEKIWPPENNTLKIKVEGKVSEMQLSSYQQICKQEI
jgi:hypothetical protein